MLWLWSFSQLGPNESGNMKRPHTLVAPHILGAASKWQLTASCRNRPANLCIAPGTTSALPRTKERFRIPKPEYFKAFNKNNKNKSDSCQLLHSTHTCMSGSVRLKATLKRPWMRLCTYKPACTHCHRLKYIHAGQKVLNNFCVFARLHRVMGWPPSQAKPITAKRTLLDYYYSRWKYLPSLAADRTVGQSSLYRAVLTGRIKCIKGSASSFYCDI